MSTSALVIDLGFSLSGYRLREASCAFARGWARLEYGA
jgi:hypothetical protein